MADSGQGRTLRLVRGRSDEPQRPDVLSPIAKAACAGDQTAVRTFIFTIGPHLLRVVRRVLGPGHPDVHDVVQESAIAVMEALPTYRGESTVLHFVCRIGGLVAINVRRKEAASKRAALRDHKFDPELAPSHTAAPDAELAARATTEVVRELLDSLPIEQAEVTVLHCILGYTVPEIAATSKTSPETVRSRLRLAKHALRQRVLGDPRIGELIGRSQ